MREKTERFRKYIKTAGNIICGLSIFFVLAALVRTDFDVLQGTDVRSFVPVFVMGICLKTGTVFMSARVWCLWLEFFAKRQCDRKEALRVYAKANIGKYLPGNVMHYVGRNLFAERLELSQKQLTAASVCEIGSLVTAAFSMGTLLAFSEMKKALAAAGQKVLSVWPSAGPGSPVSDDFRLVWVTAALLMIMVIAAFAGSRKKRTARCLQEEKRTLTATEWLALIRSFLAGVLMDAAVLTILGLVLVLFYWYLGGRPTVRQALEMTAAYMIAWVLGFVIPGAPGGIGVREMVLTLLLAPVTGKDCIVVLGVLHRLVTVLGDFAAYILRKRLLRT